MHNFIDPARRHINRLGKTILTHAHWFQEFFQKNFARMNRG